MESATLSTEATRLTDHYSRLGDLDEARNLYNNGRLVEQVIPGQLRKAQRELRQLENEFGPDSTELRSPLIEVAYLQARLSNKEATLEALERCIAITATGYGPNSYDVAKTIATGAGVLAGAGWNDDASVAFLRAIELANLVADQEKPWVLALRREAAEHVLAQGHIEEGRQLLNDALTAVREAQNTTQPTAELQRDMHERIVYELSYLANRYSSLGEPDIASHVFEEVLELHAVDKSEHLNWLWAMTYNHYGLHLERLEQLELALAQYMQALQISQRAKEPDPEQVASAHLLIGGVYSQSRNWEEAEAHLQRVLDLLSNVPGTHRTETSALSSLGFIASQKGDIKLSIEYLIVAAEQEMRLQADGHSWDDLLGTFLALADSYRLNGNHSAAKHVLEIAAQEMRLRGDTKLSSYSYLKGLTATILNEEGQFAAASDAFTEAAIASAESKGFIDDIAIGYWTQAATALRRAGELEKAETAFLDLAEKSTKVLGPNHAFVARAFYELGLIYNQAEMAEAAVASLNKSLQIYQQQPSLAHSAVRNNLDPTQIVSEVYFHLAKNLASLGKQEEARSHYRAGAELIAGRLVTLDKTVASLSGDQQQATQITARAALFEWLVTIRNARAYFELGVGQQAEALRIAQQSLKLVNDFDGVNPSTKSQVLESLSNIAILGAEDREIYRLAVDYQKQLIAHEESLVDVPSEEIARLYTKLSLLLIYGGTTQDFIEMKATALKAISIIEALYGKNAPLLIGDYPYLNWLDGYTLDENRPIYDGRSFQGPLSQLETAVWALMSDNLRIDEWREIYEVHQKFVDILTGMDNPNQALLAHQLAELGESASNLNEFDYATELLVQALALQQELGFEHSRILKTQTELAAAVARTGDTKNAELHFLKSIRLATTLYGNQSVEVARVLDSMCSNMDPAHWVSFEEWHQKRLQYWQALEGMDSEQSLQALLSFVDALAIAHPQKALIELDKFEASATHPEIRFKLQLRRIRLLSDRPLEASKVIDSLVVDTATSEISTLSQLADLYQQVTLNHFKLGNTPAGNMAIQKAIDLLAPICQKVSAGSSWDESLLCNKQVVNYMILSVVLARAGKVASTSIATKNMLELNTNISPDFAVDLKHFQQLEASLMAKYINATALANAGEFDQAYELAQAARVDCGDNSRIETCGRINGLSLATLFLQGHWGNARAALSRLDSIPEEFQWVSESLRLFPKLAESDPVALAGQTTRYQGFLKSAEEVLPQLSESEKLSWLMTWRPFISRYIQLWAEAGKPAIAYDAVLTTKGLADHVISTGQRQMRSLDDPEVQSLQRRLMAAREELSTLVLSAHRSGSEHKVIKRIEVLTSQKSRLQRDLQRAMQKHQTLQAQYRVKSSEICDTLEPNSVLIDYTRNHNVRMTQKAVKQHGLRYSTYRAFVLRGGSCDTVGLVDLGDAQIIDDAITSYRSALLNNRNSEADARRLGAAVRDLVWSPLESYLSEGDQVLVVPDGAITTLPFSALPLGGAGYQIEQYTFVTLANARDVIRFSDRPTRRNNRALVVGNINYDSRVNSEQQIPTDTPGFASRAASCLQETFVPLPATAEEMQRVSEILQVSGKRNLINLSQERATEQQVRYEMPQAGVVHFATHGFFAGDNCRVKRADNPAIALPNMQNIVAINPMIQTGLVFAGANNRNNGPQKGYEDGILTAEEIASMDLSETDLVVLSACETGLGEVVNGEGVLGLQRAFSQAGARSFVLSLWTIEDESTKELMIEFYQNLFQQSLSPAQALRAAQLTLLERNRATFGDGRSATWGAFIQSGDWQ